MVRVGNRKNRIKSKSNMKVKALVGTQQQGKKQGRQGQGSGQGVII